MKHGPRLAEPEISSLALQPASSWPYALREFVKGTGTETPVGAAQTAADRLLKKYFSNNASDNDPISVASLCDLLGVEIRGKLPRATRRGMWSHFAQSSTHTAKLSFESNRPVIEVMDSIAPRARVSAAHELGHYLIHLRDGELDYSTLRGGSTPEEEVLSEYIGRLLLMPLNQFQTNFDQANGYSLACLTAASKAVVSMHASAARIGDPDRPQHRMRGIIFWRLHPTKMHDLPTEERLTPNWHLCAGAFIPIRKCQARKGSIIATLASSDEDAQGVAVEDVEIGTLTGRFQVDAFAWGSVRKGTRCVLSVFINPD